MSAKPQSEFGPIRKIFWPIHGYETKKFLPMGLMMMFILFNYTIMRDTKDSLVITTIGAEALSFLKLYATLPLAILFMLCYSKMGNILKKNSLFHCTFGFFLAFFALFGFVIYPNAAFFHPDPESIKSLIVDYPRLSTAFKVYGNWSFGLFYVMSELFGTAGISLLFWRFANDVVDGKKGETFRFYPLFGLIGNSALIFSGTAIEEFAKVPRNLPAGIDPFVPALHKMTYAILVAGAATMFIYQWMQMRVFNNPDNLPSEAKKKKSKPKLSVMDGIKYVFNSKHLGFIALLVICYGTALAITEAVWKSQVRVIYPSKNEYQAFMGMFSKYSGFANIIMMILGSNFIRKFGWRSAALATPFILLVTGIPFFCFVSFKGSLNSLTQSLFSLSPTAMAVWLGFGLVVFVKGVKYALFDPTKEMAYLPLGEEGRGKGKAAVDVVGGRAGKSSGALIQQIPMVLLGVSLQNMTGFLGFVVITVGVVWAISANGLHKSILKMKSKDSENESLEGNSSENSEKKFSTVS
jgi:ATP:ADP antiporter, AAA family